VVVNSISRSLCVADINGGGPELRVTTHRGSLKLKKV
jgi:hypothetical protein